jgi:uncharacterized FlaG/YvyC family protein
VRVVAIKEQKGMDVVYQIPVERLLSRDAEFRGQDAVYVEKVNSGPHV